MKKIIPFLLFVPLFLLSIYIGFIQLKSIKSKRTRSIVVNTINSEEKSVITPTNVLSNIAQSITPTPKLQNDSQINLIISSPESGTTVNTNVITITGSTEPSASVSINDREITANKDGSFKTSIALDEGENYISIVAYNELGNVAEREIIVTRAVSGI